MIQIALAPSVLAEPSSYQIEELEAYIDSLLGWLRLLRSNYTNLLLSSDTTEALFNQNAFPAFYLLKALCERASFTQYSPNDIAAIVNELLTRSFPIEDYAGVSDLLWDQFDSSPELKCCREGATYASATQRLLLIGSLGAEFLPEVGQITFVLDSGNARVFSSELRARIDFVECQEQLEIHFPAVPFTFTAGIRMCFDVLSLTQNLDPIEIWCSPAVTIGSNVTLATVAAYCSETGRDICEATETGLPKFELGEAFYQSLVRHGFDRDAGKARRIIAAMVDILLRRNLRQGHVLRVGKGPNEPQRMRGEDGAMRWDIDHHYHLHYWMKSDGTPEFAAVVLHNDFSIPC